MTNIDRMRLLEYLDSEADRINRGGPGRRVTLASLAENIRSGLFDEFEPANQNTFNEKAVLKSLGVQFPEVELKAQCSATRTVHDPHYWPDKVGDLILCDGVTTLEAKHAEEVLALERRQEDERIMTGYYDPIISTDHSWKGTDTDANTKPGRYA